MASFFFREKGESERGCICRRWTRGAWYALYACRYVLYVDEHVPLSPPNLAEEQVELLARAVVSSLRQEELDLLLDLLLVQMPAVLIVHAGSCCGVRGP